MGPATISFLDRVDREPEATKLQLVRRFMENDPMSFFHELRAMRPILVLKECTLVALYDDA